MEQCASCHGELDAHWKYCIYCGRPRATAPAKIPSAITFEQSEDAKDPAGRKFDAAFWVGVGMGALGLALIIYAAIQIYGSQV